MESITRRNLVGAAAIVGASAALTSVAGSALAEETPAVEPGSYEAGITWDGLYDVVLVGDGVGGLSAAIEAGRAGASTLILEKAPNGLDGGCTRLCQQCAWALVEGKEDTAREHLQLVRGGYDNPSDAVIDAAIEGLRENPSWAESLGGTVYTYKEATGNDDAIQYPEYPGGDSFYTFTVAQETGMGAFFKLMKSNVEALDNVAIWYESTVTEILRDPDSGIVLGVSAQINGQTVNIRARNGVVLASGGYENNERIMQDYADLPGIKAIGPQFNTGDGVLMAQRIGAQISAMPNVLAYISGLYEDGVTPEWVSGNRIGSSRYTSSIIYVGSDGTRFANEATGTRHGHIPWHGDYILQRQPEVSWCVFDEAARTSTYFSDTYNNDPEDTFSLGTDYAVESGHFIKADTIEELAGLIDVPAENLAATIERWNFFCEQGEDYEFHRSPEAMAPFAEEGPYYAFRLVQSVLCTEGGPRRNENAQIIDVNDQPIPHLYGAGECGEMITHCYPGAMNMGAGMVFGRIAGRNAAVAKEDGQPAADLVVSGFAPVVEEPAYEAGENQVIGIADAHNGNLVLRLTMDGDTISQCEALQSYETPNIGGRAVTMLSEQVVGMTATEVADIDTISHATDSSRCFKAAVANALA